MSTREEKNRNIQKEIEYDELREKRKRITIFCFKIVFFVVIIFTSFYLYTKYISTSGLIVKEKRISSNKLPSSFHGLKIIQFTDLEYGSTIYLEDVKTLVKNINIRKPDIIIFTGNLIDKDYNIKKDEEEKLITELNKLSANIGKYAVTGNNDENNFYTIMKQINFTILDNSHDLVYNNDNNPITITGLSSNKSQDIDKAFKDINKDTYNILLMHEADTIDDVLTKYNVDMVLAGNSLNGQICLTKDLCLIKKEGSKKYFKEYYKINKTTLYISSGIGSPKPNFRFMARPSINFFRLSTK